MSDLNQEEFFRLGLNLSENEAHKLKNIFNLACVGLALAAGAGLAQLGVRSLNQPMAPAPSKNMKLVMLLAGLGVGMAVVGITCKVIKLKIENYLSAYSDAASAIGGLTPAIRKELQEEARKLLALEQNILEMERNGSLSDPSMA